MNSYFVAYLVASTGGVGCTELRMSKPVSTLADIVVMRNSIADGLRMPHETVIVTNWRRFEDPA